MTLLQTSQAELSKPITVCSSADTACGLVVDWSSALALSIEREEVPPAWSELGAVPDVSLASGSETSSNAPDGQSLSFELSSTSTSRRPDGSYCRLQLNRHWVSSEALTCPCAQCGVCSTTCTTQILGLACCARAS